MALRVLRRRKLTRQKIILELCKAIETASIHAFQEKDEYAIKIIAVYTWQLIVHLAQLLSENNFCQGCMYSGKCTVAEPCSVRLP